MEANRASFYIKSAPKAGTLVEITFPATRVLAAVTSNPPVDMN